MYCDKIGGVFISARCKIISLFFIDGESNGRMNCTLTNWPGKTIYLYGWRGGGKKMILCKQLKDSFTTTSCWLFLIHFELIKAWARSMTELVDLIYSKGFDSKSADSNTRLTRSIRNTVAVQGKEALIESENQKQSIGSIPNRNKFQTSYFQSISVGPLLNLNSCREVFNMFCITIFMLKEVDINGNNN